MKKPRSIERKGLRSEWIRGRTGGRTAFQAWPAGQTTAHTSSFLSLFSLGQPCLQFKTWKKPEPGPHDLSTPWFYQSVSPPKGFVEGQFSLINQLKVAICEGNMLACLLRWKSRRAHRMLTNLPPEPRCSETMREWPRRPRCTAVSSWTFDPLRT